MTLAQDLDFSGRRVLVTGAANGFGEAMADLFHAAGASLVLADIEEEALVRVATRCRAEHHVYDQSDIASIERLAAAAGPVDTLINNAGILVAKPLLETTLEEARRVIDIDLLGALRLMQLVGAGMVSRKRGVILSIGSQTAFSGGENRAVYAAAKAAISQLTKAAAVAVDGQGRSVRRSRARPGPPGTLGHRGRNRQVGDVPGIGRGGVCCR